MNRRAALWAIVLFCAVVLFTRSDFMGDTGWYAGDIAGYQKSGTPALLWEPGHLLWRPVGWLGYRLLEHLGPYAGEPITQAAFVLVVLSFISSLVSILLFQAIALRAGASVWLSLLVSASFFSFYTILEYSRSGASYIPSLMCLLFSLRFTMRAMDGANSMRQALAAGIWLGLGVLCWAPILVSSLGIAAAMLLWNRTADSPSTARRLRLIGYTAAASLAVIIAGYSIATLHLHITSLHEFRLWLSTSTHGWSQSNQLVRMVSGLPRSFISLGYGGIALKRYLFHDPYAAVSLVSLAVQHLWKVGLFYLFAGCLFLSLIKSATGRQVSIILAASVLPVLFVAVFILESGAPERYLPMYPFLCLAVAYSLNSLNRKSYVEFGVLAFLVITCLVNVTDLSAGSVAGKKATAVQRLGALQSQSQPGSLVALVTQTDEVFEFDQTALFDSLHRKQTLQVYDVIKVATDRVPRWKQEFAERATGMLAAGRNVWVSKRLLSDKPIPSWRWTEGDDRRIAWKDLKPFFSLIEYGADAGGNDGFLSVRDSPHNIEFFRAQTQVQPMVK